MKFYSILERKYFYLNLFILLIGTFLNSYAMVRKANIKIGDFSISPSGKHLLFQKRDYSENSFIIYHAMFLPKQSKYGAIHTLKVETVAVSGSNLCWHPLKDGFAYFRVKWKNALPKAYVPPLWYYDLSQRKTYPLYFEESPTILSSFPEKWSLDGRYLVVSLEEKKGEDYVFSTIIFDTHQKNKIFIPTHPELPIASLYFPWDSQGNVYYTRGYVGSSERYIYCFNPKRRNKNRSTWLSLHRGVFSRKRGEDSLLRS